MSAAPIHADNAAQAEYWNATAGQRWTDHQEHQGQVLRPVSDRLIAAAKPKPGERVIDVRCGCGATTIDFAERVGREGAVLGLDVSEPMLMRARERASQDLPITLELADATVHDLAHHAADLVVSRFGVMFWPIRQSHSPTCAGASSLAAGSPSPAGARPGRIPG